MKEYQKPFSRVVHLDIDFPLLSGSIIGGEIGGSTDCFDARQEHAFDEEDEW